MRLINADKLEIDTCYARSLNKAESIYDYSYSEKQIQNAPTVEAIPIEWIKKWMKNELYKSDVIRMLSDWEKTKECEGMNFWEILVKEHKENE